MERERPQAPLGHAQRQAHRELDRQRHREGEERPTCGQK